MLYCHRIVRVTQFIKKGLEKKDLKEFVMGKENKVNNQIGIKFLVYFSRDLLRFSYLCISAWLYWIIFAILNLMNYNYMS